MSSPVIPAGGGATSARKWVHQIDLNDNINAPNWVSMGYVSNFQFSPDNPSNQDGTTYGDGGYSSQDKTGVSWSATATVLRKTVDGAPTTYDAAQEHVRLKIGKLGGAARVNVRVFEYDVNDPNGVSSPRIEAYVGVATVSWQPQGGAQDAEDSVQIPYLGNGALTLITHPYPATASVPAITSKNPATASASGGTLVNIYGSHFTGVTGVTFGGTAATNFEAVNDGWLIATAPTHTAGSAALVVTNGTGPSTTGGTVTFA